MDMDDRDQRGDRRAVTTDQQSDEQRRQARQAERIRDLERMMLGAAAFTRRIAD